MDMLDRIVDEEERRLKSYVVRWHTTRDRNLFYAWPKVWQVARAMGWTQDKVREMVECSDIGLHLESCLTQIPEPLGSKFVVCYE